MGVRSSTPPAGRNRRQVEAVGQRVLSRRDPRVSPLVAVEWREVRQPGSGLPAEQQVEVDRRTTGNRRTPAGNSSSTSTLTCSAASNDTQRAARPFASPAS